MQALACGEDWRLTAQRPDVPEDVLATLADLSAAEPCYCTMQYGVRHTHTDGRTRLTKRGWEQSTAISDGQISAQLTLRPQPTKAEDRSLAAAFKVAEYVRKGYTLDEARAKLDEPRKRGIHRWIGRRRK